MNTTQTNADPFQELITHIEPDNIFYLLYFISGLLSISRKNGGSDVFVVH